MAAAGPAGASSEARCGPGEVKSGAPWISEAAAGGKLFVTFGAGPVKLSA